MRNAPYNRYYSEEYMDWSLPEMTYVKTSVKGQQRVSPHHTSPVGADNQRLTAAAHSALGNCWKYHCIGSVS